MKSIIKILITTYILLQVWVNYAAGEPWLRIKNTCDEKYPKEARGDYNRPQYQLGYNRCIIAFNSYDSILNEIVEKMPNAYSWNSITDLEYIDKLFENLANVIETNWEWLVWWINRDTLLQDIQYYRKKVQIRINEAKASKVPKSYIDYTQSQGNSTPTSTWATTNEIKNIVSECKKWFSLNKKTWKCGKVLIIKKKEVTR